MRKFISAFAITLALIGITAYASIPSPSGVINGCYKNSNGTLTVIDSSATCPAGTTSLNWNQTGPQGATGAAGPQGPAGGSNHITDNNLGQIFIPNSGYTQVAGGPTWLYPLVVVRIALK